MRVIVMINAPKKSGAAIGILGIVAGAVGGVLLARVDVVRAQRTE